MNYAGFVTYISTMAVIQPTDTNLVAILPSCIDYAEQRLYRELDLAATSYRNSNFALTAGNRNLTTPQGTFVVLEKINIITPFGTTNPELGTRNPVTIIAWEILDATYGSSSGSGVPQYAALQDAATIAFGPWPDQAYQVEQVGTLRPGPLSVTNPTTLLTTFFPDLFGAAAMVFMSGYMRNFGSQADDPKMAESWESQYGKLLASALSEEARKQFEGAGWSWRAPMPMAAAG